MASTVCFCCSSSEMVAGASPLLGAVVAELSMVAALDLHHILGVVQLILHTLVQRAVNSEGVLRGVVPVDISPQQDQAIHLIRVICSKLRGHPHSICYDSDPDSREKNRW